MSKQDQPRPWPVIRFGSNYARRAWWRGFELSPGVSLKTTVHLRPALAAMAGRPRLLLPHLVQAASGALTLHPRLNHYIFWGRLRFAGLPVRVGVVLENRDGTCDMVPVAGGHQMSPSEISALLSQDRAAAQPGPWLRLREKAPLPCYWAERLSGVFARRYQRQVPPLFLSQLGVEGIEELSFTPAHSMALYPGWPTGGVMPLTLCFSHALANARPVARFLLTVRDLLE